jgi:hypothetical protein
MHWRVCDAGLSAVLPGRRDASRSISRELERKSLVARTPPEGLPRNSVLQLAKRGTGARKQS